MTRAGASAEALGVRVLTARGHRLLTPEAHQAVGEAARRELLALSRECQRLARREEPAQRELNFRREA